nr:hypothetical protein [Pandoravirus aubagnensis]
MCSQTCGCRFSSVLAFFPCRALWCACVSLDATHRTVAIECTDDWATIRKKRALDGDGVVGFSLCGSGYSRVDRIRSTMRSVPSRCVDCMLPGEVCACARRPPCVSLSAQ